MILTSKRVEARINTGQKKMEETRNEVTIIMRKGEQNG